jgi:hypothetical protein
MPNLYYGPPARILATLLDHHIIPWPATRGALEGRARGLGLEVSLRTAQRVWRGEIASVGRVEWKGEGERKERDRRKAEVVGGGPLLVVGEEERVGIADILRRAARAGYLELGELELRSRPGEISVRARVYEPEEEYE